jgi:hypothetical protein
VDVASDVMRGGRFSLDFRVPQPAQEWQLSWRLVCREAPSRGTAVGGIAKTSGLFGLNLLQWFSGAFPGTGGVRRQPNAGRKAQVSRVKRPGLDLLSSANLFGSDVHVHTPVGSFVRAYEGL